MVKGPRRVALIAITVVHRPSPQDCAWCRSGGTPPARRLDLERNERNRSLARTSDVSQAGASAAPKATLTHPALALASLLGATFLGTAINNILNVPLRDRKSVV